MSTAFSAVFGMALGLFYHKYMTQTIRIKESAKVERVVICINCGSENPFKHNYCGNCGSNLKSK